MTSLGVQFLEVGACLVLAVSATMDWVCLERQVPLTELGKYNHLVFINAKRLSMRHLILLHCRIYMYICMYVCMYVRPVGTAWCSG